MSVIGCKVKVDVLQVFHQEYCLVCLEKILKNNYTGKILVFYLIFCSAYFAKTDGWEKFRALYMLSH